MACMSKYRRLHSHPSIIHHNFNEKLTKRNFVEYEGKISFFLKKKALVHRNYIPEPAAIVDQFSVPGAHRLRFVFYNPSIIHKTIMANDKNININTNKVYRAPLTKCPGSLTNVKARDEIDEF